MQPVELLTVSEVARMFDVSRHAATRWAREGQVPAIRTPGGRWKFRAEDIEPLLTPTTEHNRN